MLENIFISSEDCFAGETKDGRVKIGCSLDLHSDPTIVNHSIEFDEFVWTEEKGKLRDHLKLAINSYQKQYNVYITYIAMIGDVYRKGERFLFGRLINSSDNPLDYIYDFDYINVGMDLDEIRINYRSGELQGDLKLYLMTVSKARRLTEKGKFRNITSKDFEAIQRGSSAVTVKKLKKGVMI